MPRDLLVDGELYLYGMVGEDFFDEGFTDFDVVSALAEHGRGKPITVHINSGGGYVHQGKGIYNALKAHRGEVTTRNEGVAASAASLIFMAGATRIMTRGSLLMLHNPEVFAIGDVHEIEKTYRYLQADTDLMADIYAEASGQDVETVLEQMKDETWLKPEGALELGYCDKIEKGAKASTATAFPYRQIYAQAPSNLLHLADQRGWSKAKIRKGPTMPTNQNPNPNPNPAPVQDPPNPNPAPAPAPQNDPPQQPADDRASMAAIAAACATAGVPALAEALIRSGATMEQATARINDAKAIRTEVDMARKSMASTLDPRLADQLIAGGSSLEHARSEIFRAVAAIQQANPTYTGFQPQNTQTGQFSEEAATAAWDKAIKRANARLIPTAHS